MFEDTDSSTRYEWMLEAQNADDHYMQCIGPESDSALETVFTGWLRDRGDISTWSDAPQFGKVILTHTTLSVSVVAVWLGISPEAILAAEVTDTPPWTFDGPDEYRYELSRTPPVETVPNSPEIRSTL